MQPCRTLPRMITPISLLESICWVITDSPSTAQVYINSRARPDNGPVTEEMQDNEHHHSHDQDCSSQDHEHLGGISEEFYAQPLSERYGQNGSVGYVMPTVECQISLWNKGWKSWKKVRKQWEKLYLPCLMSSPNLAGFVSFLVRWVLMGWQNIILCREKQEIVFRGAFLTILFPIDRFVELGPSSRTFFSEEGFSREKILELIFTFYQVENCKPSWVSAEWHVILTSCALCLNILTSSEDEFSRPICPSKRLR